MNFRNCYHLAAEFFPKTRSKTLRKRWRFALRLYFFYRPLIQRLEDFFSANETRRFVVDLPKMKEHLYKPQVRTCFYHNSNINDREYFLTSHFQLLEASYPEETIKQIYSNLLRPFTVNEGENTLTATLGYDLEMAREGFLLLSLALNGTTLYKMAFWLMEYQGKKTLCLGALQGGRDTLETNRQFTKEFWGLRPQTLAIQILRWYAKALGMEQILTFPRNLLWSRKIAEQTAIDELWQEQGATPIAQSPFIELAYLLPHKPLTEVPTRKRSMYRKRYEFLDRVEVQFTQAFSALRIHASASTIQTVLAPTEKNSHHLIYNARRVN